MTYGDKLANENPFFYCEECYRPLHYSADSQLLYDDYQVYEYGARAFLLVCLRFHRVWPILTSVLWADHE